MTRILAGNDIPEQLSLANTLESDGATISRVIRPNKKTNNAFNAQVSDAVTPAVFRTCWWLAFGYHIINGVFILIIGAVQLYISIPAVYESLWLISIERTLMVAAGWSMVVVAVGHWTSLSVNIVQSLCRLRLSFGHDSQIEPEESAAEQSCFKALVKRAFAWPLAKFDEYLSETGLFGVYGDYFYVGFYARQAFEICLQTNQAYQLSRSVQNWWVNGFVVIMIFVSCIFVPVVNRVLRRNPPLRRITLLTLDIVLDFTITVLIPMLVVIPRALDYDWVAQKYQDVLIYDDVWITNAVAQAQYVMISSWMDYVSTIFPHVSSLVALETIKGLVYRNTAERKHLVSSDATMVKLTGPRTGTLVSLKRKTVVHRATMCFYAFAGAWAIFVAACHAKASLPTPSSESCKLRLSAWLTANTTCSVVDINCHRLQVTGTEYEITTALAFFEPKTTKRVILSHCPALSIPPRITEFENLLCLELFNSTLVNWRDEAALTKKTTPRVNQLHFIATDLAMFPPALLTNQLPSALSILFHRGNLSELPDRFGDVWKAQVWPYFSVENTLLSSLPPSFSQIQAKSISLISNRLVTLDDDAWVGTRLGSLQVSFNRNLTSLPSGFGGLGTLYQVLAENTSITALPNWLDERWQTRSESAFETTFKGSPLCSDPTRAEVCHDASVEVGYPYDIVQAQRPL